MNKAKTFFSSFLLSHVLLSTAAPVLANPYDEQYNWQYLDTPAETTQVEDSPSTSEMAVLGILGGLMLWSIFGGDGGGSSYEQPSSGSRYYRDNTSTPSYTSTPSSVKPISPFYGSCHSYDCK